MLYLKVFIAGGLLCLIFQLVMALSKGKLPLPWMLVGGVALGAILACTGVMDKLTAWGECGINVMVPVAGSAFYGVTAAVKNFGAWEAVAGVVLLLAWLYVGPAIFGSLLYKKNSKKVKK